jgi:hypothetical protein
MSCYNKSKKKKQSFWCRAEALESAEHIKKKYGTITKPYQCSTCHDWHLGPDRFTCGCTSSNGDEKWAYGSRESAEQTGGGLRIYECPSTDGYHITHTRGY